MHNTKNKLHNTFLNNNTLNKQEKEGWGDGARGRKGMPLFSEGMLYVVCEGHIIKMTQ